MRIQPPYRWVSRLLLSAITTATLGAFVTLAARPAWAQVKDRSIAVDLFEPALGAQNFLTVHGADVLSHKQFGLGLYLDYQRNPATLSEVMTTPSGEVLTDRASLVGDELQAYLGGAIGIKNFLQIGLGVPIALSLNSSGTQVTPGGGTSGGFSTTAFGDLYLEGKFRLWQGAHGLALALAPGITLPTGDKDAFAGDSTVTGRVRGIFSFREGRVAGAANIGVLFRQTSILAMGGMNTQISVGNQLLYGGSLSYELSKSTRPIVAIVELYGRHGFDSYLDSAPMETDGAIRISLAHALAFSVGGGAGLVRGIGSPQVRAFAGLTWAPDYRDRDGDGIPDMEDQCPDQPEDRDGFRDDDGCPEDDNDGDGIPDSLDKCPNEPEDLDNFQDDDGCPDPDNDGDGIDDIHDACPNAPEDHIGRFPNDGCPNDIVDSDHDGIPDVKDKCPDEPEDKDGFQDDDGCPDPDNDGDGVPDAYDECPNQPEDADGFEDDDGCPDPDNDHDGIPDTADRCPNQPETVNGIKDEDGCPDEGAVHVVVAEHEVTVDSPILFTKAKLRESAWLLDQVALVLKGHLEIVKLRIEAHPQTGEAPTEAQRRAAAVKEYLVKKGVDAARLTTQPQPDPGATVAFIIEEKGEAKTKPKAK